MVGSCLNAANIIGFFPASLPFWNFIFSLNYVPASCVRTCSNIVIPVCNCSGYQLVISAKHRVLKACLCYIPLMVAIINRPVYLLHLNSAKSCQDYQIWNGCCHAYLLAGKLKVTIIFFALVNC